mmetsp:Transcript_65309/g.129243  ORF Transcript_65309/g.129243 Transcript_65309/m.129243 type:complete len:225 (+) Transcript_65309:1073-1747(+)
MTKPLCWLAPHMGAAMWMSCMIGSTTMWAAPQARGFLLGLTLPPLTASSPPPLPRSGGGSQREPPHRACKLRTARVRPGPSAQAASRAYTQRGLPVSCQMPDASRRTPHISRRSASRPQRVSAPTAPRPCTTAARRMMQVRHARRARRSLLARTARPSSWTTCASCRLPPCSSPSTARLPMNTSSVARGTSSRLARGALIERPAPRAAHRRFSPNQAAAALLGI